MENLKLKSIKISGINVTCSFNGKLYDHKLDHQEDFNDSAIIFRISDPLGEKMVELVTKMFILPENSRNLPAFILKLFPERTGYSTRASIIEVI